MAKTAGVPAVLLDGTHKDAQAKQQPGAFYYYRNFDEEGEVGIIHSCPCGCRQLGSLPLVKEEGRPCWSNSGTREKPTLSPSVGIKAFLPEQSVEADGFHWHGWLRNGVWESV